MLHINKIIIKNFRPYYGVQTFDFGEKNGLSIVLGDNGIGKTSLIKAIKYVLYGEFDSLGEFRIKNEMNIVAWEQETFDLYVALDFSYYDDKYILKRIKRIKPNVNGFPQSDQDFEDIVTLQKNGDFLAFNDTNNVLKNIIPKKISEYILFEGETINKYKDLLDNQKNQEIFDSIKKILGITTLENSKDDLESQLEKYKKEKISQLKEQTKNQKLQEELRRCTEELDKYNKDKEEVKNQLTNTLEQIKRYDAIMQSNQRLNELMAKKTASKTKLDLINQEVNSKKNLMKEKLKQYKNFCYDFIISEINNIPNDIQEVKKSYERNKELLSKMEILKKLVIAPQCDYCGHDITNKEIQDLNERIKSMNANKIHFSIEEIQRLREYDLKIETFQNMIKYIENKDFKKEIQNLESEIYTLLIKQEMTKKSIKGINDQIENLGGVGNMEEVIKSYAKASKNEDFYRQNIQIFDREIQKLNSKIEGIVKKNPVSINFNAADSKIEKIQTLIEIMNKSIDVYSEEMRKKVQEASTEMFRRISENPEYDHLEFDEHYGLKLIDISNRVVPNISSGYMTLITISLIYGLHTNSSLTGTIILDAPFSVLTNFHRDKIIHAFQDLSDQVLLLVYRDQIDLETIRSAMQGRLINEYEIYQDRSEINSSYKTNIKEAGKWLN